MKRKRKRQKKKVTKFVKKNHDDSEKLSKSSEKIEEMNEENILIRDWIKELLKKWETKLDEREESIKNSAIGKVESRTLDQCREHLKPLLKLCKKNALDIGMRNGLATIIQHANDGNFIKAHDHYILIAIGNAAWPIGVTSVGIHTRKAREQVEQKNVAHVMNNEMQRKFLTSFKRLLRFAQDLRPDLPPSQKVNIGTSS
mmetsp:Transcript_26061/g.32820  ORF Transcript_26061/g.32820 Transcript_26061/m.32820 type:complete len:200 (-) Transcript_26061:1137-1736(-)